MQVDDLHDKLEGDRASISTNEEMLDLNKKLEGDQASVSASKEMLLSKPRLNFNNYESNQFIL